MATTNRNISRNLFSDRVMSPTEAAYFAGIVDGEGTIGLYRTKRSASTGGHRIMPMLAASNTNFLLLEWLRNACGNGILSLQCKNQPHQKNGYCIRFTSNQIRHILPQILPYLVIKAEQARLMLQFLEVTQHGRIRQFSTVTGQNLPLEATIGTSALERGDAFANKMRELNQRGVKPAEIVTVN